ncbi:cupredoxin domain-containing protein [Methanobacterium sp.]|jgi:plastocyanin|uniref:cupredoxin domain-containing protein n=1 Tax=Methanobacterium sp. TaxID=2164 RepID=UPI0031596324
MTYKYYIKIGIAVIILGVVITSGCTQNPQQNTTSTKNTSYSTVTIQNYTYTPNTLTVKAGTNVMWINEDSAVHDVTSDSGAFSSPDLNKSDKYTYNFTKTGEYAYHCDEHPSMTGKIIVQ